MLNGVSLEPGLQGAKSGNKYSYLNKMQLAKYKDKI